MKILNEKRQLNPNRSYLIIDVDEFPAEREHEMFCVRNYVHLVNYFITELEGKDVLWLDITRLRTVSDVLKDSPQRKSEFDSKIKSSVKKLKENFPNGAPSLYMDYGHIFVDNKDDDVYFTYLPGLEPEHKDGCHIHGFGIFDEGTLDKRFAEYHRKNMEFIDPWTVRNIAGYDTTPQDVVDTIDDAVKKDASLGHGETVIREYLCGSIFPYIADILNASNGTTGFTAFDTPYCGSYAGLMYLPSEERKKKLNRDEAGKVFDDLTHELQWPNHADFIDIYYTDEQAASLGYYGYETK